MKTRRERREKKEMARRESQIGNLQVLKKNAKRERIEAWVTWEAKERRKLRGEFFWVLAADWTEERRK